MKLNKKFLASFMAMTMAAAPMSAYADYEISGVGTITTLETEIYNVVLPTADSIKFNVDPYGILSLKSGTTLKDVVSAAAGTVTSSATAVVNKSSVPIDVDMQLYFTSTAASNGAVSLDALDVVKAGNADLYLEVVPLSGASLSKVVTGASLAASASAIGNPVSDKAFSLSKEALSFSVPGTAITGTAITATGDATSTTGTSIKFSLKDVSYAYDVITGGSVNAVTAAAVLSEGAVKYTPDNVYSFAITGFANPDSGIWKAISDAKGNIELMVKFTISKNEAKTGYYIKSDSYGAAYFGITSSGGITDLDLLSNVKVNGISVTPHDKIVDDCFLLLSGQWNVGNVVTFTYNNIPYTVKIQ